jgi:hypothetical protein
MSEFVTFKRHFEITPAVDPDGTPTYMLWASVWPGEPISIARNADRAVLEDAIRHLEQKP